MAWIAAGCQHVDVLIVHTLESIYVVVNSSCSQWGSDASRVFERGVMHCLIMTMDNALLWLVDEMHARFLQL